MNQHSGIYSLEVQEKMHRRSKGDRGADAFHRREDLGEQAAFTKNSKKAAGDKDLPF